MKLSKYSIGIGDRFGHQGQAQLQAILKAQAQGVEVTPVWNKSHREHTIIGTRPADVRAAADAAVKAVYFDRSYHVDADHISLKNVDLFIEASDFFTLDVADFIDQNIDESAAAEFAGRYRKYAGTLALPGISGGIAVTADQITRAARKYLGAVREAGKIYRHILAARDGQDFITEVSMDETATPQTPVELFLILAAIAEEQIPANTIAPKFTGRFNKGVDYVGDVAVFAREFEQDLAVLKLAIREFNLPDDLKLSVHSGSDKFSLYGPMRELLKRTGSGVHLKTAGTTWLEELIGLALAGGSGLALAKEIYAEAHARIDELTAPYATVIDIDRAKLPGPGTVKAGSSDDYVKALRHDPTCPAFNSSFRQLLHVGYKIAAEMGDTYRQALKAHATVIAANVTENLYDRHIRRVFI